MKHQGNNTVLRLFAVLLLVLMLPVLPVQIGAETEGAWVLVNTIEVNTQEDITAYNQDTNAGKNSYLYEMSGSEGNYYSRVTYVGRDRTDYDPDAFNGETMAFQSIFNNIPSVIEPGQPFSIMLTFLVTDQYTSFFSWLQHAVATYGVPPDDENGVSWSGKIVNADGTNWFTLCEANDWQTINETLSAEFRTGSTDGEHVAIYTRMNFGNAFNIGTYFVYEWRSDGSTDGMTTVSETSETSQAIPSQATSSEAWIDWLMPDSEETASEPYPENYSPKDENGDYIDSGVKIGEIDGEVLVRPGDNRLGWEWVEPGTVLYEGDHIMTKGDAMVIINFPDMTTFVMKPNSELIIDYDSTKKESKWAVVNGRVWANVKKMVKDGSMDMQMSQAVAGIKGTIFVCEEIDGVSTLKVIEGKVTFTDTTGTVVTVKTGQMVSADETGMTEVTAFDVDAEYADWDGYLTEEAAESHQNGTLTVILIIATVLILSGAAAFLILKNRHPKTAVAGTVPPAQPAPVTFCGYCGKPVKPGEAFCPNCGKSIK